MSDPSDMRDEDPRPEPPRPARPPSAEGRGGGKAGERKPRAAKPTPVRAMTAVDAPPPPVEPDTEEREVTAEGEVWTVRVVGRSGGARASDSPLLLLGFWAAGTSEGGHAREALVVGRALTDMTAAALETAFAASRPPPPPRDPAAETGGRGRRGRGRRRGS